MKINTPDTRFQVHSYQVADQRYPSIMGFDDLDQAILHAWFLARSPYVSRTEVINPWNNTLIASFWLKMLTVDGYKLIVIEGSGNGSETVSYSGTVKESDNSSDTPTEQ